MALRRADPTAPACLCRRRPRGSREAKDKSKGLQRVTSSGFPAGAEVVITKTGTQQGHSAVVMELNWGDDRKWSHDRIRVRMTSGPAPGAIKSYTADEMRHKSLDDDTSEPAPVHTPEMIKQKRKEYWPVACCWCCRCFLRIVGFSVLPF